MDTESADTNVEQYLYSFVILGSLSVIIDCINRDFDVPANKLTGIIYIPTDKLCRAEITLKEQPLNHMIHDFKTINGFKPFHTVKSSSENSSTLDNSESLIST